MIETFLGHEEQSGLVDLMRIRNDIVDERIAIGCIVIESEFLVFRGELRHSGICDFLLGPRIRDDRFESTHAAFREPLDRT